MKGEIEQFSEKIPLENIKVPTLVAHGTLDGDVQFWQAKQAADLIPGAQLYAVEAAHHLINFHPKSKEMFDAQVAFAL